MRLRPIAFAFTALLLDCATLDKLPSGTCGNGVVDDNEDCDSFPAQCGTPSDGAAACRLKCGTGEPACPDGWGCSVDNFCREPTAHFANAGDAISTGVSGMVSGDFDGDRRMDILGSGPRGADNAARARVHYFSSALTLDQVTTLPAPLASPLVRDFTNDGIDDFAFGFANAGVGGFGIMTGQSDRSLVPIMFPSFKIGGADVKAVQIRGTKRAVPGTSILSGALPENTSTLLLAGRFETAGVVSLGMISTSLDTDSGKKYTKLLPAGPEDFVGTPRWASIFDKDPTSACGDVALAMNVGGKGQIQIYSPCAASITDTRGGAWSKKDPFVLSLDGPLATAGAGIHLADIDGDGHIDVIFATPGSDPSSPHVYVALSNGLTLQAPQEVSSAQLPDVPLASGDINGDGVLDYVVPTGIVFSEVDRDAGSFEGGVLELEGGAPQTQVAFVLLPSARRSRWTSAQVVRMNADLLPDVVAASSDQPDIDFFGSNPTGAPVEATIATNGPVTYLTAGDFDGDQLGDVVFVEGHSGTTTTDVAVSYGNAFGPPGAPQSIGRIAGITDLQPSAVGLPQDINLFLRQAPTDTDTVSSLAVSVLFGSGDRQPLAPLLCPDGDAAKASPPVIGAQTRLWAPAAVLAGPLVATNEVDLLGIAVGYTFDGTGRPTSATNGYPIGIWLAPGLPPQPPASGDSPNFDTATEIAELPPAVEVLDPSTGRFDLTTASADIDSPPDGLLDLVAIGKYGGAPSLIVLKPSAARAGTQTAPVFTPLGSDVSAVGVNPSLKLLDVDGDGLRDAVTVLDVAPVPASGPATKVVVYFNTGGKFDGAHGVSVVLPSVAGDQGAVAAAIITTSGASASGRGTRGRTLAVVTQHSLYFATFDAAARTFTAKDATALIGSTGLIGATAILAGDFDGDGVEDLAIADGGAIRIVHQYPRLP